MTALGHRPTASSSSANLPVAQRTSAGWTFLFFLTLLATVSRGALEVVLPKSAAYAVQLGVVIFFVLCLFMFGRPHQRQGTKWLGIAAYAFLLTALISMWVSLSVEGIDYGATYVGVTLFFAAILVVFSCIRFEAAKKINFGAVLSIVGILLLLVASAQQFAGFALLPGSDRGTFGTLARPASLTGSYLHYPLVAALIGVVLIGIAGQRSKVRFATVGVMLLGGVALSLSRSGIVIVFVALAAGVLLSKNLATRVRNILTVGFLALAALFVLPSEIFVSRVLSIFDSEGSGNQTRFSVWTRVLDLWFESPLIIGSHTGQFTNVTGNLTTTDVGVAESGVLQMLISFGLLGLISYYALMFGTVRAATSPPAWFRAAVIGGIVQSAVYQSIEVFPFMVFFAMIPFIADGRSTPGLREPLGLQERRTGGRPAIGRAS